MKDTLNDLFNKEVTSRIVFKPGFEDIVIVIIPMLEMIISVQKKRPRFTGTQTE